MRFGLVILILLTSLSSFAQRDSLKFWNGEYMVISNDSVIYPSATNGVFTIVESRAEYPGGNEAFDQYIAANMVVPDELKGEESKGIVKVLFTIGKDGLPKNIIVQGDTTLGRGHEALRLIRSMPRWKPAHQHSKIVPMRLALPISFNLESREN
ncbi:MAG: energy transducer TonB [Bacteroidota bacterium]